MHLRPNNTHISIPVTSRSRRVEVEQGLTSYQTHYMSYQRRFSWVKWSNRQCQSKEDKSRGLGYNPSGSPDRAQKEYCHRSVQKAYRQKWRTLIEKRQILSVGILTTVVCRSPCSCRRRPSVVLSRGQWHCLGLAAYTSWSSLTVAQSSTVVLRASHETSRRCPLGTCTVMTQTYTQRTMSYVRAWHNVQIRESTTLNTEPSGGLSPPPTRPTVVAVVVCI